ncbi:MAG: tetratricopeptide repeat protein, partial [Acidobacteriota bacterium]
ASLEEMASWMRQVDGRKHVLLFSQGFDGRLLFGDDRAATDAEENLRLQTGQVWDVDTDSRFGSSGTIDRINDMTSAFARADCTVHTIDSAGVRGAGTRGSRDSLFMIANETGGELYENTNDLGIAMGEMLTKTSVTYVLAFQPEDLEFDGDYRKLRVRLKDAPRGARIAHRPGYYAPDPDAELNPFEQQLDLAQRLLDGRVGGGLDLATSAIALRPKSGEDAYVPVLIEIGSAGMVVGDDAQTRAEIFVYALDETGAIVDNVAQTLTFDRERLANHRGIKLFVPMALGAGDYAIRTLVRNPATAETALQIATVEVPADLGTLALLPPIFPERTDEWMLVRSSREEVAAIEPAQPFWIAETPFVPAARARFTAGSAVPVVLMGYGLGRIPPSDFDSEVLDVLGQPVAVSRLLMSPSKAGEDGLDRILGVFYVPEDLTPGAHTLIVEPLGREPLSVEFEISNDTPSALLAINAPPRPAAMDPLPGVETGVDAVAGTAPPARQRERVTRRDMKIGERYRILLAAMGETTSRRELLDSLAAFEMSVVGDDPESRVRKLARAEVEIAAQMAARDPESLVPLIMLHHDLALEHKKARRAHLLHHSVRVVQELAARYAETGATRGSQKVAARALASLGGYLQQSGPSLSVALFDRALGFDRHHESALLGLAAYFEKRGGPYEQAIRLLETLIEEHPDSREGRLRLAINQVRVGDGDEAEPHFRRLLAGQADWVTVLAAQEMARYLADDERLDAAIEVLESTVERAPDVQKLYIQLAHLQDRNRDTWKASQTLEQAAKIAGGGTPPRGRYNQLPLRALTIDRQELAAGAESRRALVAQLAQGGVR